MNSSQPDGPAAARLIAVLKREQDERTQSDSDVPEQTLVSAAISANGERVVTCYTDGEARVWETKSGRLIHAFQVDKSDEEDGFPSGTTDHYQLSPDGERIAVLAEDSVRLHDVATGREMATITGHFNKDQDECDRVSGCVFSPDGSRLATAAEFPGAADAHAQLWDAVKGERIAVLETHVFGADPHFSPDGRFLVTESPDHTCNLHDGNSGKFLQHLEGGGGGVHFSSDGRTIVLVGIFNFHPDNEARVYELD